jgi:hypothetical protein
MLVKIFYSHSSVVISSSTMNILCLRYLVDAVRYLYLEFLTTGIVCNASTTFSVLFRSLESTFSTELLRGQKRIKSKLKFV